MTERKELLLARGLEKSYSERVGLAHTMGRRLWNLGRAPGQFCIFENVDFTLYPGECVALMGGNGSGKSTFLRCLGGVVEPTNGEIIRIGRMASLLSHGFGAYEELPVRNNIVLAQQLLGATLAEARSNIEAVAATAELGDRLFSPTSHLSEGMRAKIALSALAHTPFQVALLDESLNHVDKEFRDMFFDFTRKWLEEGRSVMITSHDDNLLERFATRKLRFRHRTLAEID
ncbi:MAG: ATP-binding cassette domain-containing protein [Bdellovibrionota bacterium]